MPHKRISIAITVLLGICSPAVSQTPGQPQKSLERRPADWVPPVSTPAPAAKAVAKSTQPKEAPADYIL